MRNDKGAHFVADPGQLLPSRLVLVRLIALRTPPLGSACRAGVVAKLHLSLKPANRLLRRHEAPPANSASTPSASLLSDPDESIDVVN
jgi:hypothetical protein